MLDLPTNWGLLTMSDLAPLDQATLLAAIPLPWQVSQWQRLLTRYHQDQLAHAYLFSGASGTGKTLLAQRFADLLLCMAPEQDQPCGHCKHCQAGGKSGHPDILQIAPEEGSRDIKVEQIRAITDFTSRTSFAGNAKVVLVKAAHRMNISASNALLKTLEEPGKKTYLILISDLPGYLSATIRSRCQRVQFAAPGLRESEAWLQTQITADIDAAGLLAATHNQPMRALELAATDAVADQRDYWEQLAQVISGACSPQQLVSRGLKLGELAAVEYLMLASTTLVKLLVSAEQFGHAQQGVGEGEGKEKGKGDAAPQTTANEADGSNGSNKAQRQTLANSFGSLTQVVPINSGNVTLTRQILRLYQDGLAARQQLLSASNPNPQLLLESLAYRWSQLRY